MKKTSLIALIMFLLTGCNNVQPSENSNSSSNTNQETSSIEKSETSNNSSSVEESEYSSQENSSYTNEESETSSASNQEESSSSQEEPPVSSKARNITNFLSDEGDIPLINIYTTDSAPIDDKEIYTPGHLNIVEQPNNSNIILPDTTMGIRLRGNSTLAAPKKAYRIKFDKKTSLFDLPAAKSWVLLANYFDKSNLRNYLAYLTANKLDNLYFQPSSIMVEVNVNDEYQGLYLLCEQMQTGKGRVDIEKKKDENGNLSFLLELDDYGRLISEGEVLDKTFIGVDEKYYKIKYPEGDDLTASQVSFIKEQMTNYRYALINQTNTLQDYIDIDSFIDSYFVEELFKNVDGDFTSMYYYWEPGKKITAGPVWDFDISLDVVGLNDIDLVYTNYHFSSLWMLDRNSDYKFLATNEYYSNMFNQRFKEIKDLLYENLDELEIAKTHLSAAQKRNAQKWAIPGDVSSWIAARYDYEYASLTTIDQHYNYLKERLNNQLNILDKQYN